MNKVEKTFEIYCKDELACQKCELRSELLCVLKKADKEGVEDDE